MRWPGRARFTVVLVGEDSLAANVGHLAALTGGQIFVSSGLNLPEVLPRAIASMRVPRLRQAKVPQGLAVSTAEALAGGMRIAARWSQPQRAAPAPYEEVSRAVAAYAAWLALPCLEEKDAAELAEAEGVVCHLTAMVLVDEAGEAQDGLPAQRKVPLMTPRTAQSRMRLRPVASAEAPMMSAPLPPPDLGLDGPRFCLRAAPENGPLLRKDRSPRKARAAAPSGRAWPAAFGRLGRLLRRQPTVNLQRLQGQVDWSRNPDALLRGAWYDNLPPDVLAALQALAQRLRCASSRRLSAAQRRSSPWRCWPVPRPGPTGAPPGWPARSLAQPIQPMWRQRRRRLACKQSGQELGCCRRGGWAARPRSYASSSSAPGRIGSSPKGRLRMVSTSGALKRRFRR
ncbi:hypothetical protein ACFQU7_41965 [Pseudoroseomonas wenyumeiae]